MSVLKKTIKEAVGFTLLQTFREKAPEQEDILSIFFHDPPVRLLDNILNWLRKEQYSFIDIYTLKAFVYREQEKPAGKKLAFLSLDDAWKRNLQLIPVIEKHQAPITIFVPTQAVSEGNYWWEYASLQGQVNYTQIRQVEDFKKLPADVFAEKISLLKSAYRLERSCMTLEELQALNQHELVTLGAHTVTHPILKMCTPEQQAHELLESKRQLSEWLDREIGYLAYPNGDYNEDTLKIAQEVGYQLCFSTRPGKINVERVHPYAIPRNSIEDDQGYYESLSKVSGAWWKFKGEWNN